MGRGGQRENLGVSPLRGAGLCAASPRSFLAVGIPLRSLTRGERGSVGVGEGARRAR